MIAQRFVVVIHIFHSPYYYYLIFLFFKSVIIRSDEKITKEYFGNG